MLTYFTIFALIAGIRAQYNFQTFTPCEQGWQADSVGDLPCTIFEVNEGTYQEAVESCIALGGYLVLLYILRCFAIVLF